MTNFSKSILASVMAGALALPFATPATANDGQAAPTLKNPPVQIEGQTLDPAIQAMLEANAAASANSETAESGGSGDPGATAEGRAAIRQLVADIWAGGTAPAPELASVSDHVVRNGNVSIPVRVYRPKAQGPLPIIVYYHGGAWYIGGIEASDLSARQMAHDAQAIIVSVEYRLAPEAPYPASWDDAETAFAWVVDHAATLGGQPDQVCVGGDSAGGNLSIAVTTRRLDKGQAPPLCQILYYPAPDNRPIDTMRATYASSRLYGEGFNLDRSFTDYILPRVFPGQNLAQPEISPLFAKPRKMPPTLIATAGFDPLRDSQRAYAAWMLQSGGYVIYREFPTLIHGFLQHTAMTPAAVRASRETAQAAGVLAREAARANAASTAAK